ncbi:Steroid 17-alpha-hydroxylase/17,20 lyase [Halotydeus destructor]|nr:Steroid 17-alpha-hydroxylase/17,20 lyase [Halotydeus destructor]
MVYLVKYPEAQIRLRAEIKALDHDLEFMGNRDQFPFSEAFVAEVLRLQPHTVLLSGHVVSDDMDIMGYKLKKGTILAYDPVSLNRDSQKWPEPDTFNPDRFLDSDGHFDYSLSNQITQFGFGGRLCPGKDFIRQQYGVMLVRMIRCTSGSLIVSPPEAEAKLDPLSSALVLIKPQKFNIQIVAN